MRKYVQQQTSGLPTIFYLISATNFILFLFHFAFYNKQEMNGDLEGSVNQTPKSKFPMKEDLGMSNRNLHHQLAQQTPRSPRDVSKTDIQYNAEMVSISEISAPNTERLDQEPQID